MDSYLDPSLAGTLAFLDTGAGMHQGADPTGMANPGPLLAPFDYEQWINPQATVSYHVHPGSSGLQHPVHQAGLAPRDQLVPGHHPFGGLHSEPVGSATRLAVGPPHRDATQHAGADALSLVYGPADFSNELFGAPTSSAASAAAATSTSGHARATASPHAYPSQPALVVDDRRHDLVVDDVSSYSIAAYGDGSASGSPVTKRTSADSAASAPAQPPAHVQRSPLKVPVARGSPAIARSSAASSGTHTPRTPQADESVPEAALHLLRLAQPDGSTTGSVATASTGGREDEGASCDEDAEGESDDTSIHSIDQQAKRLLAPVVGQQGQLETRVWQHDPAQPPLHVQRGGGPGSRRPSASESVASTRTGRPAPSVARTQREASVASNRSRALSDAPSTASPAQAHFAPPRPPPVAPPAAPRRTSGRVRKPRLSDVAADASSDMDDDEHEYRPDDGEVDAAEDSDGGRASSSRRKGKAAASRGKKPAKRASSAAGQGGSATKKARTSRAMSTGSQPAAPRKPRRQAYIPPNLQHRTFPPHVEISDMFPRFYRSFPVSSAFAPDSYVLKPPKQTAQPSGLGASTSTGAGHFLPPAMPGMYDDSAFAAAQFYGGAHTPIPSTSSLVDANAQLAALGYLPMASPSAYSPQAGVLPSPHQHQQHSLPAMSPALSATSSIAATPFSSQASVSTPPSTIASTSTTPSAAATPTTLGPNGIAVMLPPSEAKWNKGGEPLNLYWPRFVRGNADDKCGLCPICAESKERGGEGEQKWFKVRAPSLFSSPCDHATDFAPITRASQLKNSSYVYHMSYTHGLSNLTGPSRARHDVSQLCDVDRD